jgi:hypothetical protein
VQVYVTVKDAGTQTVSATATFSQADANGSDNTASVSIAGSSSGTSTSTTNVATGGVVVIPTSNGIPVGLNGAIKSVAGADRKAPTVHALRSAGRRGRSAPLEFRIYDDSGIARATATVERNGKPVGSAATGFGPVAAGSIYYVGWHVPAKARKGRYSFCVVAVDRARHSSKQSCAPLTLR